jgi:hypothetical protein
MASQRLAKLLQLFGLKQFLFYRPTQSSLFVSFRLVLSSFYSQKLPFCETGNYAEEHFFAKLLNLFRFRFI